MLPALQASFNDLEMYNTSHDHDVIRIIEDENNFEVKCCPYFILSFLLLSFTTKLKVIIGVCEVSLLEIMVCVKHLD